MKYEVYTDGSCLGNPGPGGYAFVIVKNGKELLSVVGKAKETTNNRMELKAIVRAVKHLCRNNLENTTVSEFFKSSGKVEATLYSDSAYCINAINEGWIYSWATSKWKTKTGEEIKNKEDYKLTAKTKIQMLDYQKHKFVDVGSGLLTLNKEKFNLLKKIYSFPYVP